MTTAKGRAAAQKAWKTRRTLNAWAQAHAAEAASKVAFKDYYEQRGWRVAFFEGKSGAPRTGIIDAVAFRLGRKNADVLDLRLVQLKGGKAGITAAEIGRLKAAASAVTTKWILAAFDGKTLQIVPDDEP